MKQAPQAPTVTLREACEKLALDYAKVRLLFAAAKRTPQGWVVLAHSVANAPRG